MPPLGRRTGATLRCGTTLLLTAYLSAGLLLLFVPNVALADGPVWGPVVKPGQQEVRSSANQQQRDVVSDPQGTLRAETAVPSTDAPAGPKEGSKDTIAAYLDKQLENEFRAEEAAHSTRVDLNETLSSQRGSTIEQVVKVSSKRPKHNSTSEEQRGAAPHTLAKTWDADPTGAGDDADDEAARDRDKDSMEQDVDRLIDADNNEYVLSRSKAGVALTLDPLLIQDLTVVLTASSVFGGVFEAIRQPVLNGYILAGSIIGPDGLALVKEMVQVESLAQVGVQLLLFGLGMEFSVDKMKEVGSVAVLGGFLQILLFIAICAVGALAIGGALLEGIFVGALVSMSSTSVVVKALGPDTRSAVARIVIGTLILQDCSVGLMFALMPVLSSLNDPASGLDPETTGAIVLLILKVLLKLAVTLMATAALAQTVVPQLVHFVRSCCSDELFQTAIVGYCLSCAWVCGRLGLSHELGAFLAGVMISTMDQHEAVLHATEQVRNVFTGLFLASIGLVISPLFIVEHFVLLAAGALVVLVVKSLMIALVVWNFRYSWNTSLCVGLSLAQVGEFAFVLLSLASQLGLVSNRLSMLLLGVTAISLLTTPLVLKATTSLLRAEGAALPTGSAPEATGKARTTTSDVESQMGGRAGHFDGQGAASSIELQNGKKRHSRHPRVGVSESIL